MYNSILNICWGEEHENRPQISRVLSGGHIWYFSEIKICLNVRKKFLKIRASQRYH